MRGAVFHSFNIIIVSKTNLTYLIEKQIFFLIIIFNILKSKINFILIK